MVVRDAIRDQRFSIREISEKAEKQDDVVRLDIGQPDFGTPDAATERLRTAVWGIQELRAAIAARESAKTDLGPEHVMVTNGGMGGVHCVFNAVLDAGDEVLLNDPAWPPYSLIADSAHATARQVPYILEGAVNEAGIRDAITEDTEILVINSPENPTGRVYTREEIRRIGSIAMEHDVHILADEAYDNMVYEGRATSPAEVFPDRTFLVNSVSKDFAMTGWRVGWVATPDEDVIHDLGKVNRAAAASPNHPGQVAALGALQDADGYIEEMLVAYRKRRSTVLAELHDLGWPHPEPGGAFYAFPDTGRDSWTFAHDLLEEAGVAVVPGEP
ncbi:MAG: pyridoxal phosphate-dependent aminotransferase, partial [Candidatus Nanohaloarchaea archaeon]